MIEGVTRPQAAAAGGRILLALEEPFDVDGFRLFVSTSQGIALSEPGETAEDVLGRSDAARYWAKHRGRGRTEFADQMVMPAPADAGLAIAAHRP